MRSGWCCINYCIHPGVEISYIKCRNEEEYGSGKKIISKGNREPDEIRDSGKEQYGETEKFRNGNQKEYIGKKNDLQWKKFCRQKEYGCRQKIIRSGEYSETA